MVKFFISHRSVDAELAKKLKEALSDLRGSVEVFISDDIEKGDAWYTTLLSQLEQTDEFILVHADDLSGWRWPYYELGYVAGLGRTKPTAFCHSNSRLDGPLGQLQCTRMLAKDVHDFLKRCYMKHDSLRAVMPDDQYFEKKAESIVALFKNRDRVVYQIPEIHIFVPDPSRLSESDIPEDCEVTAIDSDNTKVFPEMFEIIEENTNWGRIRQKSIERGNVHWLEDVSRAVWKANKGSVFSNIIAAISIGDNTEKVKPVVTRIERKSDSGLHVSVGLVGRTCDEFEAESSIGPLLASAVIAGKFRHEFLSPMIGSVRDLVSQQGTYNFRRRIRRKLHLIERLSASYRFLDRSTLLKKFSDPLRKEKLKTLYEEWATVRSSLFSVLQLPDNGNMDDIPEGVENLESEIENIESILAHLMRLNTSYFDIVSEEIRYQALNLKK